MSSENAPKKGLSKIFVSIIILVIAVLTFVFFIASLGESMETINKNTFQGSWALTVEEAQITCYTFTNGNIGVAVRINDSDYAITRNFPSEDKIDFLPDKYWANTPEFKGVLIDKRWKVPLTDLVNYGETACK